MRMLVGVPVGLIIVLIIRVACVGVMVKMVKQIQGKGETHPNYELYGKQGRWGEFLVKVV